ncbi:hypothetical protein XENOCAPTIV_006991, partial [Xenoophorus captivus]
DGTGSGDKAMPSVTYYGCLIENVLPASSRQTPEFLYPNGFRLASSPRLIHHVQPSPELILRLSGRMKVARLGCTLSFSHPVFLR